MTIKINSRGLTQFAIASVFRKEAFAISGKKVVIKPIAEPKAEIDILKGTFGKAAELQFNVCLFLNIHVRISACTCTNLVKAII